MEFHSLVFVPRDQPKLNLLSFSPSQSHKALDYYIHLARRWKVSSQHI